MYNDLSFSLTASEALGPASKNTLKFIAKDFDKSDVIKKYSKKKNDPFDPKVIWHITLNKLNDYLSISLGVCNPNKESASILKGVSGKSTSLSTSSSTPQHTHNILPEGWKINRELTITLVHPTEPSKAVTRKFTGILSESKSRFTVSEFIKLNRLEAENYYSRKGGSKCLQINGIINSAGITMPTVDQGSSSYRGFQRSTSPLISTSSQSLPAPHPLLSKVVTVVQRENNFRPALLIKNFKDVKGDAPIMTDFADIGGKYKWRLIVTPSSDKSMLSAFVEVICSEKEWSLKADVGLYIINSNNKYNLYDASFTKTFKSGGKNIKGYPFFAETNMLYTQGFIKDEELSIHCAMAPSVPEKKEEEEEGGKAPEDDTVKTGGGKDGKKLSRFHSAGDAYIHVNGFSSCEHGTIFSKWVQLEPFGRWRAVCYPRGKTTFSDYTSIGFQLERTKDISSATTTTTTTTTTASGDNENINDEWEISSVVSAHIVSSKKNKETNSNNNSSFDYKSVQTFSKARPTFISQTFAPVADILAAAEGVLDDDTLTIRLSVEPFRATTPTKTAALHSKFVTETVEATAAAVCEGIEGAQPLCAATTEAAATALGTFGFLSERVESAGKAYTQFARIYDAYEPAMKEVPDLETRENELLGSCDDPERAKELSGLIAKTLTVLLEKLDAPDDDENAPKPTTSPLTASSPRGPPANDVEKDAPDAAPKQLKSGDAKLTPELPEEWKRARGEVGRIAGLCAGGALAVRCMAGWDAVLEDECKSLGKEAENRKREAGKVAAEGGRGKMEKRRAELQHRVSVLEGDREAINKLSKDEIKAFIALIEKAQEALGEDVEKEVEKPLESK